MRYLMMFLVLVFVGCSKEPEKSANVENTPVMVQQEHKAIIKSLGLKYKVFETQFNDAMADMEQPFRIRDLDIDRTGPNTTFKYFFNDHISLVGALAADDTIMDVTIIGVGEGTLKSGLNIIMVIAGVIRAITPDMPKTDVGDMIVKLMKENTENIKEGKPSSTILNGIKYSCMQSQELGTFFVVEKQK